MTLRLRLRALLNARKVAEPEKTNRMLTDREIWNALRAKGLKPCPSKGGKKKRKRMPTKNRTEWGWKFADGREVCDRDTAKGEAEYDDRVDAMVARQNGWCKCGVSFTVTRATFGHDIPRGNGGCYRDDRIVDENGNPMNHAECWDCNGEKGSKRE